MKVKALCSAIALVSVIAFTNCSKETAATTTAATTDSAENSVRNPRPKFSNGNSSGATDPNSVSETRPPVQTAVYYDVDGNIGGFYQALPARYDSTTKKYPLMIVCHGVGELGNGTSNLPWILGNGITKRLDQKTFPAQFTVGGANYSFIILSPQFKQWPQPVDVNTLIDYAIAHYRVDATRIYVTGLSMGGGATWDYAAAYPSRVAAVVPMCGAAWLSQAQCGNIAAASLPVWAFHNDDDGTVSSNTTRMHVNYINSFNPTPAAQATIWPWGGHDCWTKASDPATKECNGLNMYEWMLTYHR